MASAQVERAGSCLRDADAPIAARFRALFVLSNLAEEALSQKRSSSESDEHDPAAIRQHIETALLAVPASSPSSSSEVGEDGALLRHEAAYTLGQIGDGAAVPVLVASLANEDENPMVRHEAAEALGAIGVNGHDHKDELLAALEKYKLHENRAVRETCEIALDRIVWAEKNPEHAQAKAGRIAVAGEQEADSASNEVFASVDPAPSGAYANCDVPTLRKKLLDVNKSLFRRYQAMFALRNRGGEEAVLALCDGLKDESSLFKHEIAYVLGQLQHKASIDALRIALEDETEAPMVRHEAAEALGSIAGDECLPLLEQFRSNANPIVSESCLVGLDIVDYLVSDDFQPSLGDEAPRDLKIQQEKRTVSV